MAYEQMDNSGSLFENDSKTTDRHPDFTGSALIGGVSYRVSAWNKVGKSGVEFVSLAFQVKDEAARAAAPAAKPAGGLLKTKAAKTVDREPGSDDDLADDVPF